MKTPILETERLILRPISLDDAPCVQFHFGKWEIIQYISNAPWPYPEDGALTHIQDVVLPEVKKGDAYVWAITLKDEGDDAIGMVNYRVESGKDNDNRGFWLALPYHGRGLITEAICAVNDFIFDVLKVDSFRTRNVKGNIGSRRIKEKTGGVVIGEVQETLRDGDVQTMELWEVTRGHWYQAKAKLGV